jgi:hypothetical protein
MLQRLLRDRKLHLLLFLALAVKLFSLREDWVERFYTRGIYPPFSRLLRALLGWIPFSLGDLLYAGAFVFLVVKVAKYLRLLARRQVQEPLFHVLLSRFLYLVLWIYLVFNLFWGLNYNRQGIATQLQLQVSAYEAADLQALSTALQGKLNGEAARVDSFRRLELVKDRHLLFREGQRAYDAATASFPFLRYRQPSIKPSLFTPVGHLFGFTGYYNPFSGEAQLKMDAPIFVKPFILCHEMAHQLGYAKENEANFVAFLTGRASPNPEFVYSAYYDVYLYAIRELARYDTAAYTALRTTVHPRVRIDYQAYVDYLNRSRNGVEPVMADFYDRYLRLNNQPGGKGTYNEVVAWLVAYMKKYGAGAL